MPGQSPRTTKLAASTPMFTFVRCVGERECIPRVKFHILIRGQEWGW
jgi:hypothetical protein